MVLLVTGCAGFIGSNIVERCLAEGYHVIGLDNFDTGHRKNIAPFLDHPLFYFYEGDIRNLSYLEELFQKEWITHVCHQAARGSVPKSIENPLLSNEVNVTGTLNLLWLSQKYHIEKFVWAISSSVYGDTPELPKIESMPYNPISPYAVTKVANEMYYKIFYNLYGLRTIGLRYFNVYGRRQDPNGAYAAIIPRWIDKALDNENLELNGEGRQTRDFTYIDDVVESNLLSLSCENKEAYGKWYNICYGERTAIAELGETIIALTWSTWRLSYTDARSWDIQDSLGDYSEANKAIGFRPKTNLHQWIANTLEWYTNNADYFQ